jgi:5-methylcytosine-specific restriction endonuclease McrA
LRKQCSFGGCNNIAVTDLYRCKEHAITYAPKKRYEHHYHQGNLIYSSQRWVNLRNQFIRHNPLCAHCELQGLNTPAYMVDHIKEIEDGGAVYDVDNLQSLCNPCHNTKTGKEVKKRSRKKKNNGFGSLSDY